MPIKIVVKNTSGSRFEMEIEDLGESIADFKMRLASVTGISAPSQRLIFHGHILKDTQTFNDIKSKHGLEDGHSMHVVPTPALRPPQSSSQPVRNSTNPPNNLNSTTQPNGANGSLPGMNGIDSFGMGGLGTMGGIGAGEMMQMQERLLRNPEQMQALLNSPMMESIMDNPEFARNMMMANPQMRELMERNPEVAHVFNDPSTFRQMMQMARNPALINEMMRNTDRQMANIEMMPGGFDVLRRMHENIQAPLMDAAQGGFANAARNNESRNGTDDNPFSSLFQNTPSNAPMPNPWAPNNGVPNPQVAPNGGGNESANLGGMFTSLFPNATQPGNGNNTNPSTSAPPSQGMGPQMPGLPAGMDSERMLQMLDNPMMQQLMQNLLNDPQMFQTMIANSPQLQALQQSNPEMARMLQNPEMMRAFINPDVIRAVRQVRDALGRTGTTGSNFGMNPSTQQNGTNAAPHAASTAPQPFQQPPLTQQTGSTANNTNTNSAPNPFAALMTALNAGGVGGAPSPIPTPQVTREQLVELYSTQLQQLRDMGFLDEAMCLQALQQSQGNVSLAIENLLSRFGE